MELNPALAQSGQYDFHVVADGAVFDCSAELPRNEGDGCGSDVVGLSASSVASEANGASTEVAGDDIAVVHVTGRFSEVSMEVTRNGDLVASSTIAPRYADEAGPGDCGQCLAATASVETK
jgi:hypothetical protein